jgi:nicotinamidase-related amidase/type 1 glutamine amidotransferase
MQSQTPLRPHRVRSGLVTCLAISAFGSFAPSLAREPAEPAAGKLELSLRTRLEIPGNVGAFRIIQNAATWDPQQTVVIVCDMWDSHHCLNAVRRVGELAPRMDKVLIALRDRGVLVIHAPSSCMEAYQDHPGRKRAQETPRSKNLPRDIGSWCNKIPSEERSTYPIDQKDGGEDDDLAEHALWAARLSAQGRNPKAPWKAQTSRLTIDADRDLISDNGEEIWSILENRGINNVILLGVHANMCVLGRPFGLRQMAKNGKNVVLMRDMTDTMYDPTKFPYVSHFSGTDLIVQHVEKFVCPSITSDQIVGGAPFRFKDDRRPHVVFLIAEDEYQTDKTLPAFAARQLARDFRVSYVFGDEKDRNLLPGVGILSEADLAVFSMRRRVLPLDQMAVVLRFVADGKAVVGIRTASHGLSPKANSPVPSGYSAWIGFDGDVLGGHYQNHHQEGPPTKVSVASGADQHPILRGIDLAALEGRGSLYKVSPLKSAATPLLLGSIPDQPTEPVAWTHLTAHGGRVFYTSLGHPDDFRERAFEQLLRNGIYWAAGRETPAEDARKNKP